MLTLPIQREWFNEILAGTKTIEYREVKPYWTSRFLNVLGIQAKKNASVFDLIRLINNKRDHFDVCFRNGYEPDSPSFIAECWLDIGSDGPLYSPAYKKYYQLHIFKIKETAFTETGKRAKAVE